MMTQWGKTGLMEKFKGRDICVCLSVRGHCASIVSKSSLQVIFWAHTPTLTLRNTRHGSVTVPLLTPLCFLLRLSHQQNKTRKSQCLPCGDKQSHFLGSAKLGHLLSRQSFHSGVLQTSVSGWFSHI